MRYPGGKARIYPFVKELLHANNLIGYKYYEPFAGGSGLAFKLLEEGDVESIHINDIDMSVVAFWKSVLNHTEQLCDMILSTPVNIKTWHEQREIYHNQDYSKVLETGFAFLFLNRTSFSGIVHSSGPIGGKEQDGKWSIDARYNTDIMIEKVNKIANFKKDIFVSNIDAIDLLNYINCIDTSDKLVYLDPPYFKGGDKLYCQFYDMEDHIRIADHLINDASYCWFLTYDFHENSHKLYKSQKNMLLSMYHSANNKRFVDEIFVISKDLNFSDNLGQELI